VQVSDELDDDDIKPAPRRRSRLMVVGFVAFGLMVVLGRLIPTMLELFR
jgi:hypothetical protein